MRRIREKSFLKEKYDILTLPECDAILDIIEETFLPPNIIAKIASEAFEKEVHPANVLDAGLRVIAPDAETLQEAIETNLQVVGAEEDFQAVIRNPAIAECFQEQLEQSDQPQDDYIIW